MSRRKRRHDTRRNTRRTLSQARRDDFKRKRDLDLERLRKRRREAVRALQKVNPPRKIKTPSRRRLDSPNLRRVTVRGGVPAALRSNTVKRVPQRLVALAPLGVKSGSRPRPNRPAATPRARVERPTRPDRRVRQLVDTRCRRKKERREAVFASGNGGRNGFRNYSSHTEAC